MTAAEAREICRAAEASGLVAMINFEFRFAPLVLQIKQLLDEGAIGAFRHASVEIQTNNSPFQLGRPWRLDPAHGGGVLNELGSHAIDRLPPMVRRPLQRQRGARVVPTARPTPTSPPRTGSA